MTDEMAPTWVIEIDPMIAELHPDLIGKVYTFEPGTATVVPGRIVPLHPDTIDIEIDEVEFEDEEA